jgi:DNA-binding NtrC family response regulator
MSDINMPGMTGLEMLPKVKAERPNVPVIMITAYGDEKPARGRANWEQLDCFPSPSTSASCVKRSTGA